MPLSGGNTVLLIHQRQLANRHIFVVNFIYIFVLSQLSVHMYLSSDTEILATLNFCIMYIVLLLQHMQVGTVHLVQSGRRVLCKV